MLNLVKSSNLFVLYPLSKGSKVSRMSIQKVSLFYSCQFILCVPSCRRKLFNRKETIILLTRKQETAARFPMLLSVCKQGRTRASSAYRIYLGIISHSQFCSSFSNTSFIAVHILINEGNVG